MTFERQVRLKYRYWSVIVRWEMIKSLRHLGTSKCRCPEGSWNGDPGTLEPQRLTASTVFACLTHFLLCSSSLLMTDLAFPLNLAQGQAHNCWADSRTISSATATIPVTGRQPRLGMLDCPMDSFFPFDHKAMNWELWAITAPTSLKKLEKRSKR